jgi:hypothetical protein
MHNSPKPKALKVASVQPVHIEVVPHTPQTSDIEAGTPNQNLPQATEVRVPSRTTFSAIVGYAIPTIPVLRSQPVNGAGQLSEREKILMEGYRISRLVR